MKIRQSKLTFTNPKEYKKQKAWGPMCMKALQVASNRGSKISIPTRFHELHVFTGDPKTFKKMVEKKWWEFRQRQLKALMIGQIQAVDEMFDEEQGKVTGFVNDPEGS